LHSACSLSAYSVESSQQPRSEREPALSVPV
jgi:hypothetical protein